MAEWLVEEGIGEHRAVLIKGERIVAARIDWLNGLAEGQVEDAVLIHRTAGSSRGTARFAGGEEALVSGLPRDASEGAPIRLRVTRAALSETGRTKLAQARPAKDPPSPRPTLSDTLRSEGHAVRIVPAFPACDWDELWDEASDGRIAFAGGELHFAPTPAMTVIDVDGALPPRDLALAAARALAPVLARFDLGGNLAVDFPTLEAKADRKAVDDALAGLLTDWPHERTAMNGFGLVQIVARLTRPSLLHRLHADPIGAAARRLLRLGERVAEPGTLLLTCHPSVEAALQAEWLAELSRRTAREVRVTADHGLALGGGFAQAVAP